MRLEAHPTNREGSTATVYYRYAARETNAISAEIAGLYTASLCGCRVGTDRQSRLLVLKRVWSGPKWHDCFIVPALHNLYFERCASWPSLQAKISRGSWINCLQFKGVLKNLLDLSVLWKGPRKCQKFGTANPLKSSHFPRKLVAEEGLEPPTRGL